MDNDSEFDDESPETQLDADRSSGDGRPPSRTAIGLGGEPDPDIYQIGQRLKCRILAARKGGYAVLIVQDGREAFLMTERKHAEGALLIGEFRYWQWT